MSENIIKKKKILWNLSDKEMSDFLDITETKLVKLENNEKLISPTMKNKLEKFPDEFPFKKKFESKYNDFKFIDLFAGIGGIRLPFQKNGGECVFSSEWNKHAKKTYFANYGDYPFGDITKISSENIPDHDILLGGFPCQAFSQAGKGEGFADTRGTLFFEIQRILVAKRPKAFLLENVKKLLTHDSGKTFKTISSILEGNFEKREDLEKVLNDDVKKALEKKLNYWITFKILKAADFGVPQNRERIFIVGFNKDYYGEQDFEEMFNWPEPLNNQLIKVKDILEQDYVNSLDKDIYTISDKLYSGHLRRRIEHKEKGNGFGFSLYTGEEKYTNTLSARYYKDGSEILIDQSLYGKNPRFLTQRECARLQGFPENFVIDAISRNEMYRQFGNSVCMKVITAIADKMLFAMKELEKNKKES
jgi:DNA (cytosine-5)-methyltransferase 1